MEPVPPRPRPFITWARSWVGIITLGAIASVVLGTAFYEEENWRGNRIWLETKAKLEARGEKLDGASFAPPSIPDDQNFALNPLFETADQKMKIDGKLKGITDHLPTNKDDEAKSDYLPYLGSWKKGEKADPSIILHKLEEFLSRKTPGAAAKSEDTPADIFARICPELATLREANEKYPQCAFPFDYKNRQPWNVGLGPVTGQIRLAKVLAYDARLELLSRRPEVALEDFRVAWKIGSGIAKQPTLVANLVTMGVRAIQLGEVEQGLAEHDWNDAQLAELDSDLSRIDSLSDGKRCLQAEVAFFTIPLTEEGITHRTFFLRTAGAEFDFKDFSSWQMEMAQMVYLCAPAGWLEINRADTVRRILDGSQAIDAGSHRVYPERKASVIPPPNGSPFSVINFSTISVDPVLDAVNLFAFSQVQLDEARIACRLERFHLAHGAYPTRLEALVPIYGTDLPHDVMSGQPYIYRLNPDGTYLLYSVGWNQKDDGGDSGPKHFHNHDSPDWVWISVPDKK